MKGKDMGRLAIMAIAGLVLWGISRAKPALAVTVPAVPALPTAAAIAPVPSITELQKQLEAAKQVAETTRETGSLPTSSAELTAAMKAYQDLANELAQAGRMAEASLAAQTAAQLSTANLEAQRQQTVVGATVEMAGNVYALQTTGEWAQTTGTYIDTQGNYHHQIAGQEVTQEELAAQKAAEFGATSYEIKGPGVVYYYYD